MILYDITITLPLLLSYFILCALRYGLVFGVVMIVKVFAYRVFNTVNANNGVDFFFAEE